VVYRYVVLRLMTRLVTMIIRSTLANKDTEVMLVNILIMVLRSSQGLQHTISQSPQIFSED
jgi:hypothetical protein